MGAWVGFCGGFCCFGLLFFWGWGGGVGFLVFWGGGGVWGGARKKKKKKKKKTPRPKGGKNPTAKTTNVGGWGVGPPETIGGKWEGEKRKRLCFFHQPLDSFWRRGNQEKKKKPRFQTTTPKPPKPPRFFQKNKKNTKRFFRELGGNTQPQLSVKKQGQPRCGKKRTQPPQNCNNFFYQKSTRAPRNNPPKRGWGGTPTPKVSQTKGERGFLVFSALVVCRTKKWVKTPKVFCRRTRGGTGFQTGGGFGGGWCRIGWGLEKCWVFSTNIFHTRGKGKHPPTVFDPKKKKSGDFRVWGVGGSPQIKGFFFQPPTTPAPNQKGGKKKGQWPGEKMGFVSLFVKPNPRGGGRFEKKKPQKNPTTHFFSPGKSLGLGRREPTNNHLFFVWCFLGVWFFLGCWESPTPTPRVGWGFGVVGLPFWGCFVQGDLVVVGGVFLFFWGFLTKPPKQNPGGAPPKNPPNPPPFWFPPNPAPPPRERGPTQPGPPHNIGKESLGNQRTVPPTKTRKNWIDPTVKGNPPSRCCPFPLLVWFFPKNPPTTAKKDQTAPPVERAPPREKKPTQNHRFWWGGGSPCRLWGGGWIGVLCTFFSKKMGGLKTSLNRKTGG